MELEEGEGEFPVGDPLGLELEDFYEFVIYSELHITIDIDFGYCQGIALHLKRPVDYCRLVWDATTAGKPRRRMLLSRLAKRPHAWISSEEVALALRNLRLFRLKAGSYRLHACFWISELAGLVNLWLLPNLRHWKIARFFLWYLQLFNPSHHHVREREYLALVWIRHHLVLALFCPEASIPLIKLTAKLGYARPAAATYHFHARFKLLIHQSVNIYLIDDALPLLRRELPLGSSIPSSVAVFILRHRWRSENFVMLVPIVVEKLLKLEFLYLLLPAASVNVAEHLDIPGVESELLHFLIGDDKLLINRASDMKGTLAATEITLNA